MMDKSDPGTVGLDLVPPASCLPLLPFCPVMADDSDERDFESFIASVPRLLDCPRAMRAASNERKGKPALFISVTFLRPAAVDHNSYSRTGVLMVAPAT